VETFSVIVAAGIMVVDSAYISFRINALGARRAPTLRCDLGVGLTSVLRLILPVSASQASCGGSDTPRSNARTISPLRR
jgi:hypothetical protein